MGATSTTSNDDTGNFAVNGEGGTVSFVDPLLSIDGGSYTISMEEGVTSNSQRIELKGGATVTLDGVTVDDTTDDPAITISGNQDVTILLADGSKNVLKGKAGSSDDFNLGAPGIQKTDSASGWLIIGIPEDSEGTGELQATGGFAAAGIGAGTGTSGSNITITGGTVTATGGGCGAGIGGGISGSGSDITISGGVVTATGGENAAGIGSGNNKSGSNITITGGTVTATGGGCGAGIGGGIGASGTDITITGGSITATGGEDAAGIGGGAMANGEKIEITGGVMKATGGSSSSGGGAGIGGGQNGSGNNNNLDGDNVVIKAESGDASKAALDGFSSIDKGLIFTKQGSSGSWSVDMYSNSVEVNGDVEFPTSLTIDTGKKITVGDGAELTLASGATLTVADGAELANDGTISAAIEANINNKGIISTKANFYLKETDKTPYTSQYQTYKTGTAVGTYINLPNPDVEAKHISDIRADKFSNWYYLDGEEKVAIKDGDNVLLNQHTFYEETVPAPDPGPEPGPSPEPTPDPEPTPAPSGWQYDPETNTWKYLNPDGTEDSSGFTWVESPEDTNLYYFYPDGTMAEDEWIWDPETNGWYWACETGPIIQDMWQWISDSDWYYLGEGGKM